MKFRDQLFFFGAVSFGAGDAIFESLLQVGENLIAPLEILLMLLVIVEPERGINADKDEDQFGQPTAKL